MKVEDTTSPPTPLHKRGEIGNQKSIIEKEIPLCALLSPLLWRGVGGEVNL